MILRETEKTMNKEPNPASNIAVLVDILLEKDLKLMIEPRLIKEHIMIALISSKDHLAYTTIDMSRYKNAKIDVRSDMLSKAVNQVLCMIDQEDLRNE